MADKLNEPKPSNPAEYVIVPVELLERCASLDEETSEMAIRELRAILATQKENG